MKLFHTALVLGKGGFGTQLGEMLAEAGGYSRILYLDDQAPDAAGKLADYLDPTLRERCTAAFVGLGNNELRLQWLQKLVAAGYQTPVFEHPAAEVCSSAALGAGTVVLPFAFVGAGTKVGAGCIINASLIDLLVYSKDIRLIGICRIGGLHPQCIPQRYGISGPIRCPSTAGGAALRTAAKRCKAYCGRKEVRKLLFHLGTSPL